MESLCAVLHAGNRFCRQSIIEYGGGLNVHIDDERGTLVVLIAYTGTVALCLIAIWLGFN
jgi:hypothetical protein